jgi:hypothetical protein
VTLSPEVLAIAERQAATDRDLLARLVRSGVAMKSGTGNPDPAFVRDIERRVGAMAHAGINLALKPNKRKAKKRGRR